MLELYVLLSLVYFPFSLRLLCRKMEGLRRLELSATIILLSQIANTHPTTGSVSLNEIELLKVNHKLFLCVNFLMQYIFFRIQMFYLSY